MKKLTILDGGMGRELNEIGAPFSQPLWSAQALIESPDHVRLAHQHFLSAGSEIITANSYACVPFHLGESLYQERGAELAEQAAIIARNSTNEYAESSGTKPAIVAGVIPPALGSYRPDLFEEAQAIAINSTLYHAQEKHVDIWIAETISSIQEFEAIHQVLKQTTKPVYYAFSLEDTASEQSTLRSGQSVKMAVALCCFVGAAGILFNCSVPEVMEQAVIDAKQVIDEYGANIEIGVYANNFAPIQSEHEANDMLQSMRELSPLGYLEYAKHWHSLGATVIGGCCGIGPKHIQALSDWKAEG